MEEINFKNVYDRQDYLSVDETTAISSNGEIFHIGDVVKHEDNAVADQEATIISFSLNKETMDVIAQTERGTARISFIYKKEIKNNLHMCNKDYCDCGCDDECDENHVCLFNDEIDMEIKDH